MLSRTVNRTLMLRSSTDFIVEVQTSNPFSGMRKRPHVSPTSPSSYLLESDRYSKYGFSNKVSTIRWLRVRRLCCYFVHQRLFCCRNAKDPQVGLHSDDVKLRWFGDLPTELLRDNCIDVIRCTHASQKTRSSRKRTRSAVITGCWTFGVSGTARSERFWAGTCVGAKTLAADWLVHCEEEQHRPPSSLSSERRRCKIGARRFHRHMVASAFNLSAPVHLLITNRQCQ